MPAHPESRPTMPSDVAREALLQLTRRRLAPTPENYTAIYHELAGTGRAPHPAGAVLRDYAQALGARGGEGGRVGRLVERAVGREDWDSARVHLVHFAQAAPAAPAPAREPPKDGAAKEAAEEKEARWREALAEGDREEVANRLQALLRLLVDNVGELVLDDQWMRGQVESVRELLAHPLDRAKLRETERALRNVLYKQSARKFSLDQARQALKDMVSDYVANLQELGRETGVYHERIGEHRERIQATDDMGQLQRAIGELLEDTRMMQVDVLRRRDGLEAQRLAASGHERRIRELEGELRNLSETARQDPLTGLLNRRGFEEAFVVESSREARTGIALSLAMLDVDNFKKLNDALGHQAGDAALEHLADVIRDVLRPTDVVARYGGEEFVIVMPGTGTEEAVRVVTRVQRSLTSRFFLANNQKTFITFSAGIAERRPGESREALVDRADQALYEAKRAGKNRVTPAP